MKATTLAAGVLAAALSAGTTTTSAADLDYGRLPDRYSGAYEDPRYRDLYGPDEKYSHPQHYHRPAPPHIPLPPATVYRDHDIYRPHPQARRYSEACVPREEVRRRLIDEGWRDFHDPELRNGTARIKARRGSGDLYDLQLDRCTGEIINADLIRRGGYGPYAQDHGPRYYPGQRPY
ncbi:MAG: hypothetical protein ACKVP7_03335 [Hyphomicrobiaceae bacterium]